MSHVAEQYRKAKQIYQTQGLLSLLRRAFSFLAYCFLEYRSYWLYAEPIASHADLNEADFMPKIDDFTFKIVTSNQEADELEAQGLEFRSQIRNAWRRLDKGAIAFCVFVGRELASISWVALTQQAKDSFNEPSCNVDFTNKEAWAGGGWTNSKYRRMGLSVYRFFRTHQFLLEHGVVVKRNAFRRGSVRPEKLTPRIDRTRYAEGRYLRILWWKSWRERPLSIEEQEAIRQTNEPRS